MPNWCYTNITISHETETEIEKLGKLIDEWTSKDYMENGFGHDWLGNVVLGSGVGTVDTDAKTDLRCRGSITYREVNGNQITMSTETAWAPMLKMWLKIIDKYLPGAELIYSAEEFGCGICTTNDPDLVGKYVIDYWGDKNIESDWEAKEETAVELLQIILDTTETNIEKLIAMAEKYDSDVSVHKWLYFKPELWD